MVMPYDEKEAYALAVRDKLDTLHEKIINLKIKNSILKKALQEIVNKGGYKSEDWCVDIAYQALSEEESCQKE